MAVSKTKPANLIVAAYEEGQRHFGENYVQELEEKATNELILERCKDIRWHFIGHLQSNKVNKVLCLPNLYIIETVDSQKLATLLNKNWPKFGPPDSKLRIMLQVNTSAEDGESSYFFIIFSLTSKVLYTVIRLLLLVIDVILNM